MKIALCTSCYDFITPHRDWTTNRLFRWCGCGQAGVRWVDGDRGLLEVTAECGPGHVLVLGMNNAFLQTAVASRAFRMPPQEWKGLHDRSCAEVGPNYLFHSDRRACWAVLMAPGETGDVAFAAFDEVRAAAEQTTPASSDG